MLPIGAKRIADLITLSRVLLAFGLAWLGFTVGAASLPLAVWLMIADWTGDYFDGQIARRSKVYYHTWIGDHDLETDMLVSGGLLVYLAAAGFVEPWIAALYALAWALIFWRYGTPKALGMLAQAPIYGWFIWVALWTPPYAGWWIAAWIAAMIGITWPKFPKQIAPDFVNGMKQVWKESARTRQ